MGRTPCCDQTGLKKGPWTPEEDSKLTEYIKIHGPGNWRSLPKNAGLQRCGKSCRLRWTNYLRPDIKRGRFSFEEEETIIQLHSVLGNKWSAIAARLPGRTDNEIKNYWNTHIRKRLLKMGIDPVTHSPRLDLLDLSSLLNSAQLNLSNFLGLQTLVNPEAIRLLATLISSNNENPDLSVQKAQQNQLMNVQNQIFEPNHQFQNQVPSYNMENISPSPYLTQTPPMQEMMTLEQFLMNSETDNYPTDQETQYLNSSTLPNNVVYSGSDHIKSISDISENSNFLGLNENNNQNFKFDQVISTPLLSPTQLNSSSTFFNGSNTEHEIESYCSDMLKFEVQDSLDFSSLL